MYIDNQIERCIVLKIGVCDSPGAGCRSGFCKIDLKAAVRETRRALYTAAQETPLACTSLNKGGGKAGRIAVRSVLLGKHDGGRWLVVKRSVNRIRAAQRRYCMG